MSTLYVICCKLQTLKGEGVQCFYNFYPSFSNSKTGKQDAVNRPKTTDNARRNPPGLKRIGDENQAAKRPGRQSIGGAAQQPRITAQPRAKKRLSLPANAQPRIRGPGMTTDTVQRPKTASEVRRSSRLAANFSK